MLVKQAVFWSIFPSAVKNQTVTHSQLESIKQMFLLNLNSFESEVLWSSKMCKGN